jgi:1,2-dihydroxy-3-keto-5-methylthiopentene dioxygenase
MKAFDLDTKTPRSAQQLAVHGIVTAHWGVDADAPSAVAARAAMAQQGGYHTHDIIELSATTPNLASVLQKFDAEHRHTEDEVRYVLAGAGVFDIRDLDDKMVRVVVEAGDVIVVPKERYHRFELTSSQHVRCIRMFQDKAGWVPIYRAGE